MHSFSTTGETLLVTTAAERRRGAHAPGGAEGTSKGLERLALPTAEQAEGHFLLVGIGNGAGLDQRC